MASGTRMVLSVTSSSFDWNYPEGGDAPDGGDEETERTKLVASGLVIGI